MNIRKQKISEMLQREREQQFPHFYKNGGVLKFQTEVVEKREGKKYKEKEPEYLQTKQKSEAVFSKRALNSFKNDKYEAKGSRLFYENDEKLVESFN